jgi:hypothetical protein
MQVVASIQVVFFILFAVIASSLVRQGRRDPATVTLAPRQRIRPLTLEYLDVVITAVVVGPLLVRVIYLNPWNLPLALVGAAIGIPVGLLRSKVQYVRAIKATKSVVLTRSAAEYAVVVLLVIIRSVESSVDKSTSGALIAIAALLLGFPIGESSARSRSIIQKYQAAPDEYVTGPASGVDVS